MNYRIHCAALLLVTALAPVSVSAADELGFSDVDLSAFAGFTTQLQPAKSDSDADIGPYRGDSVVSANALVRAGSIPFPNRPTSQTQAFASAAVNNFGIGAVGVSGFFFQNSLPRNALVADASATLSVSNTTTRSQTLLADLLIPAPTFQFFGIGNSVPSEPARDVTAVVSGRLLSSITHPDGSVVEHTALDYGMTTFRDPNFGSLFAIPTRDAEGNVTRFEEPDGSFGFELKTLVLVDFLIAELGPGDVLELTFDYLASASTGFGETGIFAAIGDPFDLSANDAQFDLHFGTPVPEPAAWTLLAAGLVVLGWRARDCAARTA